MIFNLESIKSQRLQVLFQQFKEFVCFKNISQEAKYQVAEYMIEKRIKSVDFYIKLCELRGWQIDQPHEAKKKTFPEKITKKIVVDKNVQLQNQLALIAQEANNLKKQQQMQKQKQKLEKQNEEFRIQKEKRAEEAKLKLIEAQKAHEKEQRKHYHQKQLAKLIEESRKRQKLNHFSIKTEELSTASNINQVVEIDQSLLSREIPVMQYIKEFNQFIEDEWNKIKMDFV